MDTKQTQEKLDNLAKAMRAKGVVRPRVYMSMTSESGPYVSLYHRPNGGHLDDQIEGFYSDKSIEELLKDAEEFIHAMPTKERRQFDEFMRSLGECIEKGKRLDIEVDISPLMALVEKLSKNALEHYPSS